jgi:hypothetical protein
LHKFVWFRETQGADRNWLAGAYLVGADGVPLRGECRLAGNLIECETRNTDPLGLSLLWPVRGFGVVHLETTRLPARAEPYNLNLELVRHRLLRISVKCEEWGLFDYPGMEEIHEAVQAARDNFVRALQVADDPQACARLADEALAAACVASTRMCEFHANVFLARRRGAAGFSRSYLGATLAPSTDNARLSAPVAKVLDFVRVPFIWREIHPKEQGSEYDLTDRAIRSAIKSGCAVHGGPLLNFGVRFVPDWMYIWENDYEAIADFAKEHVRRTVQRYAGKVKQWVAASGLHAEGVFPFNFEQIMDLTRVAVTTTKSADPRAQVTIDVVQPWGEYHARNQATVPPMLYAEMAVQSGIPFDAIGLQFVFGIEGDGYHLRDMLQISSLIDRLANLGKPIQVTAVSVPSIGGDNGGAWTEQSQAQWLVRFCRMALSKPYVDSVCMYGLTDDAAVGVPGGGLLRNGATASPALQAMAEMREALRKEQ